MNRLYIAKHSKERKDMLNLIRILALFCIGISNINAEAMPKNKFYVKGSGGLVFYNKLKEHRITGIYAHERPENSFSASLALGYDFCKYLSAEILGRFSPLKYKSVFVATGTSSISTTKQNMNSYALFANLYLKYPNMKRIVPYITLGPGFMHNQSKTIKGFNPSIATKVTSAPGRNINSFAWNVGAGIMLIGNRNFSVDMGYRYLSLGKIGCKKGIYGNSTETNRITAHETLLGLTYKFN
jgi:opacity protein-like surface antigen